MEAQRFVIEYIDKVIKVDLLNLPNAMRYIIKKAIEERLMTNPLDFGRSLQGSWKGHRRLRVGDYRIIYRISCPNKTVTIVAIGHRKDIYES